SGRGAARPRARAVLSHAAPLHESQRPRQAPAPNPASNGRGRARRGAHRGARGPPLRGRVRQRPVALGLPPRVAQGADGTRRVGDADSVRRARRSLAPRLPSPMVSVRDRRGGRARPRPGVSEARPTPPGPERQRPGHDGGRDQRRPRAPRHPAPHDPAVLALPERQAGGVLGPGRGRLVAMLEHVPDLTLAFLNEATQAWVEHEYNRSVHSEIGATPLARFLEGPAVTRPCPGSVALRLAFTRSATRTQKKSDGSIVIDGRRFELPNRYRHLARVEVRYAEWDLSAVHLVDERTGNVLARLYPQDKTQNASGLRRSLEPLGPPPPEPAHRPPASPIPPLLQRLLDAQSSVGLPPAYLPKDEDEGEAP